MRSLALALPPLLALATGCTSPVSSGQADASIEDDSASHGQIVVERTSSNPDARTEIVARFVRHPVSTSQSSIFRAFGSYTDLPELGACTAPRRDDDPSGHVDLVHVGDASLESEGRIVPLAARPLPELVEWASGYVYAAREPLPNGPYILRIGKGEWSFAPNGEPSSLLAKEGSDGIELAWDAGVESDLIVVDVLDGRRVARRCRYQDTGAANVGAIPEAGPLVVHRIRSEEILVPDFGNVEVRFDASRTVLLPGR